MTFKLQVWSNPPDDAELGHQAQLITKVLSEVQAQMTAMKEEAIKVEDDYSQQISQELQSR